MGLRYVKGLGVRHQRAFMAARRQGPFRDAQDFARRTRFDKGALTRLAEAGAFECFGEHRRDSLWAMLGATDEMPLDLGATSQLPELAAPGEVTRVAWDHDTSGHSASEHILVPLREALRARGLPTAAEVNAMPHDATVDFAALAICRQQPGTASGVTFMTMEDESGFVNLVIWQQVLERYRTPVKTLAFLGVSGRIQSQDGVVHIVAKRFWKPPALQLSDPDASNQDPLITSKRAPRRGESATC